jgi:hypothetical protein
VVAEDEKPKAKTSEKTKGVNYLLFRTDFNFNGGTVVEFVKAINSIEGVELNVVIHPSCENIMVPAYHEKNISPLYIFKYLIFIYNNLKVEFYHSNYQNEDTSELEDLPIVESPQTKEELKEIEEEWAELLVEDGELNFKISYKDQDRGKGNELLPKYETAVFLIGNNEKVKPEEMVKLIQKVWLTMPGKMAGTVSYCPKSGFLIASASTAQIAVVMSIVEQVTNQ